MWDLSSLTRDWTHAPCSGNRVLSLDHQGGSRGLNFCLAQQNEKLQELKHLGFSQ